MINKTNTTLTKLYNDMLKNIPQTIADYQARGTKIAAKRISQYNQIAEFVKNEENITEDFLTAYWSGDIDRVMALIK